jgi:hypothetical protein
MESLWSPICPAPDPPGRALPELLADLMLEAGEWKAAYILNRKKVPQQTPPLCEVIRLIAQLGGFLGRKGDSKPDAKLIWLDMRDLAVDAHGMPVRVFVTEGTRADCTKAGELIEGIDAQCLLVDRGYDTNEIVEKVEGAGMQVVIPAEEEPESTASV